MRLLLPTLFFFLYVGLTGSYAQCGNYSGNINDLPVCGQYGDANGNSNWNWEITDKQNPSYCSMWYARTDANGNMTAMSSPFVDASLTVLDVISQQQDFTRAKGWELLRRDFGCSRFASYPYFILYNKYSSLMRLFIYIPPGQTNYSGIAVEITPNLNSPYPATTAFSDTIQAAPDKFLNASGNIGKGMVSIGQLAGQGGWSLVEFTPSFDPNIQNAIYTGASLQFTILGVTTNNMYASIRGGSVVSSQPIYNFTYRPSQPAGGGTDGTFDFKGVGEKFTRFTQGINSVRTEINNWANAIVNFIGSDTTDNAMKDVRNFYQKLKDASSDIGKFDQATKITAAIKAVGSVFTIMNAVIGLFSAASGGGASPAYTNYDLVLQGTITSKVIVRSFLLRVPGTIQNNNDNATYYKCPLGIFNIKNTPQADVATYKRTDRYRRSTNTGLPDDPITREYVSYRIRNNIAVSFNEGAGLDLVSVQAAIVGEVQPNANGTASYDLFEKYGADNSGGIFGYWRAINHMRPDLESGRILIKHFDTQRKLHVFQTPYTELACLNGLAFNALATTKIYLQVKAVLKKKNDPSNTPIIFIRNYTIDTYPATISDDMKSDYIFRPQTTLPPYTNYTELPVYKSDEVVSNPLSHTSPGLVKADHSITTDGSIIISAPSLVTYAAGSDITLKPGFEARYGSTFSARINNYGYTLNCTSPEIEAYSFPGNCYNTSIIALRTVNTSNELPAKEESDAGGFKIFPLPTGGQLRISGDEVPYASIEIIDQLGRVMYESVNKSDSRQWEFSLHHLPNGFYFIKVKGRYKTITKKILISK